MGSNNWGDNGFGACTSLGNSTFSDQSFGACVQSLSGWVSVKPWTIYNATPTCEDTLDGPYPVSSLYPTWANSDTPQWAFSGQAWYNGASMNESVSAAPGGGTGTAWQGSGIDSDLAEDIDTFFGNWNGDLTETPSWGTGITAFGNPDLFDTYTAQYALACLEAQSIGVQPYGRYASSYPSVAEPLTRQPEAKDPVTGKLKSSEITYTYNPNPAERNHVIEHADGKHIKLHRRITLQEGEKRKVVMEYPKGFERGPNRITFAAEYVTPDMSAPTQEHFELTKIHQKARYKKNKAIFTVKSRKLALTTMLNAQLNLVKSD